MSEQHGLHHTLSRQTTLPRAPSIQRQASHDYGAKSATDLERNRKFMDLYSRQIGAYGLEAMLKLTSLRVLIVGLRGVGVEVAKNVILAGVHTICVYDPEPVELRDLGSNFFLTEADIGKPRAVACVAKLAELNATVHVETRLGELTEDFVGLFDAVVFTRGPKAERIRWNEYCRAHSKTVVDDHGYAASRPAPIAFVSCFTAGAAGAVFSDFGPGFVVRDRDGVEPFQKIVIGMELREDRRVVNGVETVTPYTLVRFLTPVGGAAGSILDGTLVSFSEIDGMYSRAEATRARYGLSINTSGSWRCWHPDGDPVNTVRIGDTSIFSAYMSGGLMTEVKEPKTMDFRSLAECTLYPSSTACGVIAAPGEHGFVMLDMMSAFSPGGREQQTHIALQALLIFEQRHGRPARPACPEDAALVVELAKQFNAATGFLNGVASGGKTLAVHVEALDEELVRRVALMSTLDLQPLCAFFGGVIAQELVKISGKFTPLHQWLVFEDLAAIPAALPADTAPLPSRYDDQIAIYGRAFQERLGRLRMFMVGCGALGCEYVKNFALTGICCGPDGMLTITDNDRIEVSNLNRQFLFRQENVGKPKSATAASRAHTMNAALNVTCREDLLAPSTEHIFDDAFWMSLDVVCNALDNIDARLYSDAKCVFFGKPLLESATTGTGANVDVVVPGKTRSYGEGGAASEQGGIPMCTLRNFPHLIEHCIEWARSVFADLFVVPAQDASRFLENPAAFIAKERAAFTERTGGDRANAVAQGITKLRQLQQTLRFATRSPTINDCVQLAFEAFHTLYRDKIVDLTTQFPETAKTATGEPFWSGHKKFPRAQAFSLTNPLHVDFVIAAANIFAGVLRVHGPKHPSEQNDPANRWMAEFRDPKWAAVALAACPVPPYVPGAVANLEGDDARGGGGSDVAQEEQLVALLKSLEETMGDAHHRGLVPADFEKDDDDNFHIDFITAAANLRAANYHIPTAPRHKCKMIAGRIIPAVATTTAAVTGLVVLEFYKFLLGKPIEVFRNGNFDLGSNTYTRFEPNGPREIKTLSTTAVDGDKFQEAIKSYGASLKSAEDRLAALQRLRADVSDVTTASAALEPIDAAIGAAREALEYIQSELPQEDMFKETKSIVAYPNPHTLWDQLPVPATVTTLRGLVEFFASTHGLTVDNWSVQVKTDKGEKPRSTTLYTFKKPLDPALLPAYEAGAAQAAREIMGNKAVREKQRYIQAYKDLHAKGAEAFARFLATPPSAFTAEDDHTLRSLIEERAGLDLSHRKRILLDGLSLTNSEGKIVDTAKVVYHLV
eukprot:m.213019 g.213019  ORF g.213019 m.213019 type:complete len:1298 (-) comp15572_c0_seq2:162-4055(-)